MPRLAIPCLVLLGSLVPVGCSGSTPENVASSSSAALTVGDAQLCTPDAVLSKEATQVCANLMESVEAFKTDEACGMGVSHVGFFDCTSPSPPVPPTPKCSPQVESVKQCTLDPDLQKQAADTCAQQGGTLGVFVPDEACPTAAATGSSLSAKFECCGASPPPPPPVPPSKCTSEVESVRQCTLDPDLQKQAADTCAQQGGTLGVFVPDEACPTAAAIGSSLSAKFECCGAPPPPPPPQKCSAAVVSVMQCSPDAILEKQADVACAQQMGTVTLLGADEACGMGSSLNAKYECCL